MLNYLAEFYVLVMMMCSISCSSLSYSRGGSTVPDGVSADGQATRERRVQKGRQSVQVVDVSVAVAETRELVIARGGRIESLNERKSGTGERAQADLLIRIPATQLRATADSLAELGQETYRNIEEENVTEQWIDLESRLKNQVALRDRLKALLTEATTVKEALEIEKELARVQTEIEMIEAKFRVLKNRVQMASLSLDLEQRSIPGPAGVIVKSVGWALRKLFVVR